MSEVPIFNQGEKLSAKKMNSLSGVIQKNRVGGNVNSSGSLGKVVGIGDGRNYIEPLKSFAVERYSATKVIVRAGAIDRRVDDEILTYKMKTDDLYLSDNAEDVKTLTCDCATSTKYTIFLLLDLSASLLEAKIVESADFDDDYGMDVLDSDDRVIKLAEIETTADDIISDEINTFTPYSVQNWNDIAYAVDGVEIVHHDPTVLTDSIKIGTTDKRWQDIEINSADVIRLSSADSGDGNDRGGVIEVDWFAPANRNVSIYSLEFGIYISAETDIDILAGEDINIESDLDVNIDADNVNIDAVDDVNIAAGGDVIISPTGNTKISNLPTSLTGLTTGELYTQTATQLGLSGATKIMCVA